VPSLSLLTRHLLAIKQSLRADDIAPDLLVVEDLGLDSMDLAQLADRIRLDMPAIDLMPWLARAMAGEGTVASLTEFLTAAERRTTHPGARHIKERDADRSTQP
jgi:hypothetical protein